MATEEVEKALGGDKPQGPKEEFPCKCYESHPLNSQNMMATNEYPPESTLFEAEFSNEIDLKVPRNATGQEQCPLFSKIPNEIRFEIYRRYIESEGFGRRHCDKCGESRKEFGTNGKRLNLSATEEFEKYRGPFDESCTTSEDTKPLMYTCRRIYDELRPLFLVHQEYNIVPAKICDLSETISHACKPFMKHRGVPVEIIPTISSLNIFFCDMGTNPLGPDFDKCMLNDMGHYFMDLYQTTLPVEIDLIDCPRILDLKLFIDFNDLAYLSQFIPLFRSLERLFILRSCGVYLSSQQEPKFRWVEELKKSYNILMETMCWWSLVEPGLPQHEYFRKSQTYRAMRDLKPLMPPHSSRQIPGVWLVKDDEEDYGLADRVDDEMIERLLLFREHFMDFNVSEQRMMPANDD